MITTTIHNVIDHPMFVAHPSAPYMIPNADGELPSRFQYFEVSGIVSIEGNEEVFETRVKAATAERAEAFLRAHGAKAIVIERFTLKDLQNFTKNLW